MWHFNPKGLSPPTVTSRRRALLPHVFSLTLSTCSRQAFYGPGKAPASVRRYIFCDTFCTPITRGPTLSDGSVLCVVRTFLSGPSAAATRSFKSSCINALVSRKVQSIFQYFIYRLIVLINCLFLSDYTLRKILMPCFQH